MKFCTHCGNELREGVKFCPSCGQPTKSESRAASETQAAPTPPPPAQQAKEQQRAFNEPVFGKAETTNVLKRAINIIIKPKSEWHVVANEKPNIMKLMLGYVLILAAIPAIATFLKFGVIGITYWGYTSRSIAGGISQGITQLLSAMIGVYLLAWVIDLLAPSFDSKKDFGRSLQLAVYSSTPQWIAGILLLFGAGLSILIMLIGLYAIYLLAVGMPIIKETPKEKTVGYVVVTIIAMVVITLVVALIIGAIVGLASFSKVAF